MGVMNNQAIEIQVLQIIDEMKPYVQSHGGEIVLVSIDNFQVTIKLKGTCDTCPLSFYTITFGLEKKIQQILGDGVTVVIQD